MRNKLVFFAVFGLILFFTLENHIWGGAIVMAFVLLLGVLIIEFPNANSGSDEDEEEMVSPNQNINEKYLCYKGVDLNFKEEELVSVLSKHLPYFIKLSFANRQKFLQRLKKFISQKSFEIHDESGFKEMPILISASAIQISFGLEEYLLSHFSHIHIFPEEFVGTYPTLRLLEGNVSGNSINLSWKHFLKGFQFPDDGQSVGLHEMAHAYYYQNFETSEQVNKNFVSTFNDFNNCSNKALEQEKQYGNDLYSDYGLTNLQEFWAESIELFFEKPTDLKINYPELFAVIEEILNQNILALYG